MSLSEEDVSHLWRKVVSWIDDGDESYIHAKHEDYVIDFAYQKWNYGEATTETSMVPTIRAKVIAIFESIMRTRAKV